MIINSKYLNLNYLPAKSYINKKLLFSIYVRKSIFFKKFFIFSTTASRYIKNIVAILTRS